MTPRFSELEKYVDQEFLHAHNKTCDGATGYALDHVCKEAEYYFADILDPASSNYQNGVLLTREDHVLGILKFFGNKTVVGTKDADDPRITKNGIYWPAQETYAQGFYAIRNQQRSGWAHITLEHDLFPVRAANQEKPQTLQLIKNLDQEGPRIKQALGYTVR